MRFNRASGEPAKSESTGYATLEVCGFMAKELRGDEPCLSEILQRARDIIFDATYRAQARARELEEAGETEPQRIDRLRVREGLKWKDVARQNYLEENGDDIKEGDVDGEVKRIQGLHRNHYPGHYEK